MKSPRYRMKPAPRANPDGYLDGAWVVVDTAPRDSLRPRVVFRAQADGRDACESWFRRKFGFSIYDQGLVPVTPGALEAPTTKEKTPCPPANS